MHFITSVGNLSLGKHINLMTTQESKNAKFFVRPDAKEARVHDELQRFGITFDRMVCHTGKTVYTNVSNDNEVPDMASNEESRSSNDHGTSAGCVFHHPDLTSAGSRCCVTVGSGTKISCIKQDVAHPSGRMSFSPSENES